MSFDIPARTKIALVGSSGCGKSTITNLLLRFYDVESGCIKVDGNDISDYNVKKLRQDIGYVMQEPILFNWSIKDNIMYGNMNASNFDIRKAALQANATQFIESEIENLEKDDRLIKMKEDTKAKIISCRKQFTNFEFMEFEWDGMDPEMNELLFNLFNKADNKAFENMSKDVDGFKDFAQTDFKNHKGLKWDDLIVRWEWTQTMNQTMSGIGMTENHSSAYNKALKNHKC